MPKGDHQSLTAKVCDIDAERACLGSLIIPDDEDNTTWNSVQQAGLKPKDFFNEIHQTIFKAMGELHKQGMALDQLTIAHQLAQMGKLQSSGGAAYLSLLVTLTPTSCHAQYYARIIKDWRNRRDVIQGAAKQAERAYQGKLRQPKVIEIE